MSEQDAQTLSDALRRVDTARGAMLYLGVTVERAEELVVAELEYRLLIEELG